MINTATHHRSSRGFSLVEVTLALGVAGFCLVSLFGLVPIGVNSNRTSVEQTAAASVAASVIADLRSTTASTSPQFGIPVPTQADGTKTYSFFLREDGSLAVPGASAALGSATWPGKDAMLAENPRYRVTLSFVPPKAAGLRTATTVGVLVTWPGSADSGVQAATLPSRYSGSIELTTALDRN